MMQNNISQPLFAPASQSGQSGDDIDLNEIFADYFINEFDSDPMNAYTNSMANFSGGVASMAMTQTQDPLGELMKKASAQVALPTGGIKTAFHTGAPPPGGVPGVAAPPAAKKPRAEPNAIVSAGAVDPALVGYPQQQALQHPGMGMPLQQTQAAYQQAAAAAGAQGVAQQGRVALPVGVGIRLGGVGGVAPSTAQAAARPVVQGQFMWGPGTGVVSEVAVAERRQRNREHAKRSRVRKKFMLESLQEEVRDLQKENQRLRMLVQEHIPEDGVKIISECCQKNSLFVDPDGEEEAGAADPTDLEKTDFSLMSSLSSGQQCFVLSDPKLPDNPIVFASPGFYQLTGYTSKEVLGRNCRFLQGPGTDSKAVEVIRKAIATGSDATVCMLNYKSDGTPFWNQFFLAALRDSDNCIVNYVGVQCEVEADAGANALEEKVNAALPLMNKEDKEDAADEEQE